VFSYELLSSIRLGDRRRHCRHSGQRSGSLGCASALLGLAILPATPRTPPIPATVKSVAIVAILFSAAFALFGVFSGVGLLCLKNWARISALICAAIITFFGALMWLVLFNRPNIREQFLGIAVASTRKTPQKQRCPLPIAVLPGL
jgi:hypothetical protein